jgi:hypothetical protein
MAVRAGDCALSKVDRQPLSFCLSYAVTLEASVSPLARGNKKAHSGHAHADIGNDRLRLQ